MQHPPPFKLARADAGYQPHIDGMRALAVLLVIAYHYSDSRLRGGFIGVDVFFVISGYLITGILVESFKKRSFGAALLHFYQRRVRRIFPAATLVLSFLLAVGWVLMFPGEYLAVGRHVAGSAGFVENVVLWSEAGYFDPRAITKPLLHFWSLAVEEQFYIFWPFFLWLLMRMRWSLTWAIAGIAGISFGLNVFGVYAGAATSAFYLPHARAWELMAGAWLAAYHGGGGASGRHPHGWGWASSAPAWPLCGPIAVSPVSGHCSRLSVPPC